MIQNALAREQEQEKAKPLPMSSKDEQRAFFLGGQGSVRVNPKAKELKDAR